MPTKKQLQNVMAGEFTLFKGDPKINRYPEIKKENTEDHGTEVGKIELKDNELTIKLNED